MPREASPYFMPSEYERSLHVVVDASEWNSGFSFAEDESMAGKSNACFCPVVMPVSLMDMSPFSAVVHHARAQWAPFSSEWRPEHLSAPVVRIARPPPSYQKVTSTWVDQTLFKWPQQGFSICVRHVYTVPTSVVWNANPCVNEDSGMCLLYSEAFWMGLDDAQVARLNMCLQQGLMGPRMSCFDDDVVVQLPLVDPVVWPRMDHPFIHPDRHPQGSFRVMPVPRGEMCFIQGRGSLAFVWVNSTVVATYRTALPLQGVFCASFYRHVYYVTHMWDGIAWSPVPLAIASLHLTHAETVIVRPMEAHFYAFRDGRPGYWNYSHVDAYAVPHDRLLIVADDGQHAWAASPSSTHRRFLCKYYVEGARRVVIRSNVQGNPFWTLDMNVDRLPERGWVSFILTSRGVEQLQWNQYAHADWVVSRADFDVDIVPRAIQEIHEQDVWALSILMGRRVFQHCARLEHDRVLWSTEGDYSWKADAERLLVPGQGMCFDVAWDYATQSWKIVSAALSAVFHVDRASWTAALDVVMHMAASYRTTVFSLACEARKRLAGSQNTLSSPGYSHTPSHSPLHDAFYLTSPEHAFRTPL